MKAKPRDITAGAHAINIKSKQITLSVSASVMPKRTAVVKAPVTMLKVSNLHHNQLPSAYEKAIKTHNKANAPAKKIVAKFGTKFGGAKFTEPKSAAPKKSNAKVTPPNVIKVIPKKVIAETIAAKTNSTSITVTLPKKKGSSISENETFGSVKVTLAKRVPLLSQKEKEAVTQIQPEIAKLSPSNVTKSKKTSGTAQIGRTSGSCKDFSANLNVSSKEILKNLKSYSLSSSFSMDEGIDSSFIFVDDRRTSMVNTSCNSEVANENDIPKIVTPNTLLKNDKQVKIISTDAMLKDLPQKPPITAPKTEKVEKNKAPPTSILKPEKQTLNDAFTKALIDVPKRDLDVTKMAKRNRAQVEGDFNKAQAQNYRLLFNVKTNLNNLKEENKRQQSRAKQNKQGDKENDVKGIEVDVEAKMIELLLKHFIKIFSLHNDVMKITKEKKLSKQIVKIDRMEKKLYNKLNSFVNNGNKKITKITKNRAKQLGVISTGLSFYKVNFDNSEVSNVSVVKNSRKNANPRLNKQIKQILVNKKNK